MTEIVYLFQTGIRHEGAAVTCAYYTLEGAQTAANKWIDELDPMHDTYIWQLRNDSWYEPSPDVAFDWSQFCMIVICEVLP